MQDEFRPGQEPGRAGPRWSPTTVLLAVLVAVVLVYALWPSGDDTPGGGGSGSGGSAGEVSETSGMNSAMAWRLSADTRAEAGNDTARQSELLEERLSQLPGPEIVDFDNLRHRFDEQLYTWDIWGAAFVIEDGCSDDCFRDFRAYLISLGPQVFNAALRDPDSIAPVVQDAETGDWENADNVAPDAYQSATGNDFPGDDTDLSGNPRGVRWDDDDQEALIQRYPRLAARFR